MDLHGAGCEKSLNDQSREASVSLGKGGWSGFVSGEFKKLGGVGGMFGHD